MIVDGGTISFSDNLLATGQDTDTGLTLTNGGTLDAGTTFTLTGNLTTSAGGIFDATGGGAGMFSISGSATNDGTITMRDGAVGDTITVSGDYSGTGELQIDVDFATNKSDTLAIGGNVTGGTTTISVNDVSSGEATDNDVLVVDVTGTSSAGDFALTAPVIAGAHKYGLGLVGGGWYLQQSTFNPAVPTYEVYPQVLAILNTLPTLQQRGGNRYWSGAGNGVVDKGDGEGSLVGDGSRVEHQGAVWGRIEASHTVAEASTSTTNSSHEVDHWKMQFGLDGLAYENDSGKWIIGLTGYYGTANADITSSFGNGSIETEGGGMGITATWYGMNGFYVDNQAQISWFGSDLRDVASGSLVEDNPGRGYALSIEAGKRVEMENSWTMTPQAQLIYSSVDFDSFTGPNGETVSLSDGDSLRGRMGITMDQEKSWLADDGTTGRSNLYGIVNIHYEFLKGSDVVVSSVGFANQGDQFTGEIGIGGSYNWADDRYSLYGETSASTGFENFGDSYQIKGTAGIRIRF